LFLIFANQLRIKRIFLIIIPGLILFLLIWQHDLISYGFSQLTGQLKIVYRSEPGEKVLNDPEAPNAWKEKILTIQKIKKFAFDSLGLKRTNNYTTIYNQHDKPVLWVLTGSKPFKLEAKTWFFPFIGEVSYKGFFNREKGLKALNDLRNAGFDADLSPTGGWSTLGWFRDPILSNMLKKSDGLLAELIIHELTHSTVYLKSEVELNENLATFIGESGAIRFLNSYYGSSSFEKEKYLHYKHDEDVFGFYMLNSTQRLDSLYNSFNECLPDAYKIKTKKELITDIISGISTLPLYNKERYIFNLNKDSFTDNTFFIGIQRYRKNQQKLDIILIRNFNNDLKLFIEWLKQNEPEKIAHFLK
jgi:predicted aminopeptidase